MRRLLLPFAALALAVGAAPVSAGTNPYTPAQVCGAGFGVIDSQVIATPTKRLGTTYLLYNGATGRNCAVTLKEAHIGRANQVGVVLEAANGAKDGDSGQFDHYAGPVEVKARGRCVRWGGGIRLGRHSSGFLTEFEHCA